MYHCSETLFYCSGGIGLLLSPNKPHYEHPDRALARLRPLPHALQKQDCLQQAGIVGGIFVVRGSSAEDRKIIISLYLFTDYLPTANLRLSLPAEHLSIFALFRSFLKKIQ